jgi:Amt family ammonium transporter
MISLGSTSFLWVFIGFSLAFGESAGGIIGSPASFPLFLNMDICTRAGYPMLSESVSIPALLFAGYHMMFAVIAPALITGAFADRVQFPAYLLFISLWLLLVYCPIAHWIWNPNGFLYRSASAFVRHHPRVDKATAHFQWVGQDLTGSTAL